MTCFAVGSDPVAIYYWSVLRHVIKAVSILKKAAADRAKGKNSILPMQLDVKLQSCSVH